MALKSKNRKKGDPYLTKTVKTERFDLVISNWRETGKITRPWSEDPDVLHSLMYTRMQFSRLRWALSFRIPNGRNLFYHAIVARDENKVIGLHQIKLNRSGTAILSIGLTDKAWWGKGAFEEARAGLMDHFSQSPKVMRFYGRALSRNFSSVYNYKKLGFRLIGHETKVWLSPTTGEHMDCMQFEYLAEDWRAHRQLEKL
ncbi:MAG: GNAT family protein [Sulfitobacter sp.]